MSITIHKRCKKKITCTPKQDVSQDVQQDVQQDVPQDVPQDVQQDEPAQNDKLVEVKLANYLNDNINVCVFVEYCICAIINYISVCLYRVFRYASVSHRSISIFINLCVSNHLFPFSVDMTKICISWFTQYASLTLASRLVPTHTHTHTHTHAQVYVLHVNGDRDEHELIYRGLPPEYMVTRAHLCTPRSLTHMHMQIKACAYHTIKLL